jgi:hypothetical protein
LSFCDSPDIFGKVKELATATMYVGVCADVSSIGPALILMNLRLNNGRCGITQQQVGRLGGISSNVEHRKLVINL